MRVPADAYRLKTEKCPSGIHLSPIANCTQTTIYLLFIFIPVTQGTWDNVLASKSIKSRIASRYWRRLRLGKRSLTVLCICRHMKLKRYRREAFLTMVFIYFYLCFMGLGLGFR